MKPSQPAIRYNICKKKNSFDFECVLEHLTLSDTLKKNCYGKYNPYEHIGTKLILN